MLCLPGETTLAELHEIQANCRDYFVVDDCDHDCPYCYFSVDDMFVNLARMKNRYYGTCRKF